MREIANGIPDDNGGFDEHALFESLREQMTDPFVTHIHDKAREMEVYANRHNIPKAGRDMMIRKLDTEWRSYMGKKLVVSGEVWSIPEGEMQPVRATEAGIEVISNGFTFFADKLELNGEETEGHQRIGHSILVDAERGHGIKKPAFISIDDIAYLELPFASPEMRRVRFPYNHPEVASRIDEILFRSKRDDYALLDIAQFQTESDISTEEGREYLLDATEYLNSKLDIDRELPYKLVILGELYAVGNLQPAVGLRAETPTPSLMAIRHALIRPADPDANTDTSITQPCTVFYEGLLYGDDKHIPAQHVVVPASSLVAVASMRHEYNS